MTSTKPVQRRPRRGPLGARWVPYVFLAPAIAYVLLFQVVPLFQQMWISFTDAKLINPGAGRFIGFDNYVRIFTDEGFQRTLLITLIYVVVCVFGAVGIGLLVSLLLNGSFPGRAIARSLVTIPWAAPGVAIALIVSWMLNGQYGLFTRILGFFGIVVPPGGLLNDASTALPTILTITLWQLFPFSAIVLLSALQSVPQELVEATRMDGGGPLWVFRSATWPVIRPTVGLLLVLNAIWAIRRFELIWLLTRGGPVGSTRTLVIDLYSRGFESNDLGRAAAVGMVGLVISLLFVAGSSFVGRTPRRKEAVR